MDSVPFFFCEDVAACLPNESLQILCIFGDDSFWPSATSEFLQKIEYVDVHVLVDYDGDNPNFLFHPDRPSFDLETAKYVRYSKLSIDRYDGEMAIEHDVRPYFHVKSVEDFVMYNILYFEDHVPHFWPDYATKVDIWQCHFRAGSGLQAWLGKILRSKRLSSLHISSVICGGNEEEHLQNDLLEAIAKSKRLLSVGLYQNWNLPNLDIELAKRIIECWRDSTNGFGREVLVEMASFQRYESQARMMRDELFQGKKALQHSLGCGRVEWPEGMRRIRFVP